MNAPPKFIPDRFDLDIIALLQEDGRMSTRDIATRLGATPSTIRKRVRRLEDTGTMRVVAVTDFASAGYDLLLAIGVEVESRSAEAVGRDLASLPDVFSVNLTTGSHDLEILVGAEVSTSSPCFCTRRSRRSKASADCLQV